MRIRRLSGAEIEIWRRVAASVTPRDGAALPAQPEPSLPPAQTAPAPEKPVAAPRVFHAPSYRPPVSVPKPPPVGLERRYKRKVAIGRVPVEGVLDLHGMTQAQAHSALHHFILRSQRDGARLVIVVTGKGMRERYHPRADAVEPGVLRRAVPSWLRDGALRQVVIGFEEASIGHGGAGALYVRLRRPSAAP
ncbi:Smr/MutS family protein [Lichenibacterium dinghuense]|uniref:Smr/MutS family protein n=1 Tax=Lichenibacterium dinghuense TaxID=2895977 RepID=UPI001F2B3C8B|nr:Smr/MutS family protein [Lichenibacterium sp. 6Y81]